MTQQQQQQQERLQQQKQQNQLYYIIVITIIIIIIIITSHHNPHPDNIVHMPINMTATSHQESSISKFVVVVAIVSKNCNQLPSSEVMAA